MLTCGYFGKRTVEELELELLELEDDEDEDDDIFEYQAETHCSIRTWSLRLQRVFFSQIGFY